MVTTYSLNSKELGNSLIDSIKATYPEQIIEIQVREQDTTEYLLKSPANRKRLMEANKNVEEGKITSFATLEDLMKAAEEHNKKK